MRKSYASLAVFIQPHLYALAYLLLFATSANAGDIFVTAQVSGGKLFTGQLDPRTSDQELWLRWQVGTASLQRGIRWNTVKHVTINGQADTPTSVQQRAQALVRNEQPISRLAYAPQTDSPPASRPASATVSNVVCDAYIANWDQDPLLDGIVLEVAALDADGNSVPYSATIEATLETIRYSNGYSASSGGGRTLIVLGQWSQQWAPSTHQLRLDYGPYQPEVEAVDRYARLKVRVTIPGIGNFDRVIDGIRTRSFTPIANSLSR